MHLKLRLVLVLVLWVAMMHLSWLLALESTHAPPLRPVATITLPGAATMAAVLTPEATVKPTLTPGAEGSLRCFTRDGPNGILETWVTVCNSESLKYADIRTLE